MAEPENVIIPLLREMRVEFGTMQKRMDAGFDAVEKRLNKMDESLVTFRPALSADSLLSKIVTGEFEERLGVIERRLSDLETQKSD
jgi:hypothetical protein